jgi:hypothetical protein
LQNQVVLASEAPKSREILQSGIERLHAEFDEEDGVDFVQTVAHTKTVIDKLSCFEYENLEVVIHTDKSVLPVHRRDWKSVNIVSPVKETESGVLMTERPPMATIWMNALKCDTLLNGNFAEQESHIGKRTTTFKQDYFQTQFPMWTWAPAPEKVIRRANVCRVLVTTDTVKTIEWLDQVQGKDGLWFTGSWVFPGIPLLEGCACSALRVSEALGVERPWRGDEDGDEYFYRKEAKKPKMSNESSEYDWTRSPWVGAYFRGELTKKASDPSFSLYAFPASHINSPGIHQNKPPSYTQRISNALNAVSQQCFMSILPALLRFTTLDYYNRKPHANPLSLGQLCIYCVLMALWLWVSLIIKTLQLMLSSCMLHGKQTLKVPKLES